MQVLFAITLFVSAALLFLLQPMFAKMVLPLLGGTPGVWNTCMVFYQAVLLAGYVYAHVSTRALGPRRQAAVHLGLMCLPWLVLPIGVAGMWTPPAQANPIPWLLLLLALSVGLPFFVIAASAPMLQVWFADTDHPAAKDPYFLYTASNLGSMLALLGYPVVVEPNLSLALQSRVWAAGFGLLTVLTLLCAVLLWRRPFAGAGQCAADAAGSSAAELPRGDLSWRRRLRWLALALAPSSLLLGVTTHIATDIASVPLLWVIPFALYLLSFVLVFARRAILPHAWMLRLQPLLVLLLAAWMFLNNAELIWMLVPLHLAAFFVTAMVCHGELAAARPAASHLTEFYLWMSVGGVLGGLLNAIVAPILLPLLIEYPLMIVVACMLRPRVALTLPTIPGRWLDRRLPAALARGVRQLGAGLRAVGRAVPRIPSGWLDLLLPPALALGMWELVAGLRLAGVEGEIRQGGIALGVGAVLSLGFTHRPIRFGLCVAAIMVVGQFLVLDRDPVLHRERSFFGVLRIRHDRQMDTYQLIHGSTNHGMQSRDPERCNEPLTYYYRTGPLGQVFEALSNTRLPREIAVIGLGTGSIASYGRPGQHITYYEIDPAVQRIAQNPRWFTFLRDSKARVDVVLGDARLMLARAPAGRYDLLILDAFSSDAIPIHLLTREALRLYLDKLSDNGVLALHISNRYFDLQPVLGRLAEDAGLICRVQRDTDLSDEEEVEGKFSSDWAIIARSTEPLEELLADSRWQPVPVSRKAPLWTDDFSNILSVLLW